MNTDKEKRTQLTFGEDVRRRSGVTEGTHHNIPVEFRTLSIHVTDSIHVPNDKSKKKEKEVDDSEYFASMEFHKLNAEEVVQRFNTSDTLGLDTSAAENRLKRNGPNVLVQRKPNYVLKVLGYVFGGFCSVLWIGVITFFLCWMPLSTPPVTPGGSPSVVNLALAILVVRKHILRSSNYIFVYPTA
jgi:sodium/potassium-transporting ATPase subunit alpha